MFLTTGANPDAGRKRWRSIGLGLAISVACASAAWAQSEDQVKAGLEIWKSSGCADCHGAFADGDKQRDEMPTGANLRGSRLDLNAIGRRSAAGAPIPACRHSTPPPTRCGLPAAAAPDGHRRPAPDPGRDRRVITYLQARPRRRQITHEDCLQYYMTRPVPGAYAAIVLTRAHTEIAATRILP